MKYREQIINDLIQLESYVRTCFKLQLGAYLNVNTYVDAFMQSIYDGEVNCPTLPKKHQNGLGSCQVLIDALLNYYLPDCQKAERAKESALYGLVADWVAGWVRVCKVCGNQYILKADTRYENMCEDCADKEESDV